jgi:hypothetical protein
VSVRIPPEAPAWGRALILQLRQIFTQIDNPQRPTRLVKYASASALPPASEWVDCIVRVTDVGAGAQGLAYSDGTNWRRVDTNATL